MSSTTGSAPGKRLIVCCDGTWLNSDNGTEWPLSLSCDTSSHLQRPSNVTRISRAIRSTSATGIPQIIYYQSGVGSELNGLAHLYSGATGAGLAEHIREAYAFIADNYREGDEIFLIGFSRGAFTARSVAGFIASIGLLTPKGMAYFYVVFKDWENRRKVGYISPWPSEPFPNKPKIRDSQYAEKLENGEYTRRNIPIRAVAVWDTVGALGIPKIGPFPPGVREYAFVSQDVPPNVEYAFHALALDERRQPFAPTLWEKPPKEPLPKLLKQCWFPGAHSSVGGGKYEDTQISNISLVWMMSQLDDLIDFDHSYLFWLQDFNKKYYREHHLTRPWACGKIYNSSSGIDRLAFTETRTPGRYRAIDLHSGVALHPMRNTFECIHKSVRIRMDHSSGRGPDDKQPYRPQALHRWKVSAENDHYVWKPHKGSGAIGKLEEDELGPLEKKFMERTSAG